MLQSLPSWERGLKLQDMDLMELPVDVAPLVGAWIEMLIWKCVSWMMLVAPLVGAWIEILCHYAPTTFT